MPENRHFFVVLADWHSGLCQNCVNQTGKFIRNSAIYLCLSDPHIEHFAKNKKLPPHKNLWVSGVSGWWPRLCQSAKPCKNCPLKSRCVSGKSKARQLVREQNAGHHERHLKRMQITAAKAEDAKRQHSGEAPLEMIKHLFGLR